MPKDLHTVHSHTALPFPLTGLRSFPTTVVPPHLTKLPNRRPRFPKYTCSLRAAGSAVSNLPFYKSSSRPNAKQNRVLSFPCVPSVPPHPNSAISSTVTAAPIDQQSGLKNRPVSRMAMLAPRFTGSDSNAVRRDKRGLERCCKGPAGQMTGMPAYCRPNRTRWTYLHVRMRAAVQCNAMQCKISSIPFVSHPVEERSENKQSVTPGVAPETCMQVCCMYVHAQGRGNQWCGRFAWTLSSCSRNVFLEPYGFCEWIKQVDQQQERSGHRVNAELLTSFRDCKDSCYIHTTTHTHTRRQKWLSLFFFDLHHHHLCPREHDPCS